MMILPHMMRRRAAARVTAGHWRFTEGAGSSAADSSANSNTLTLYSSPSWTTDPLGRGAVSFNGTSQYGLANSTGYQSANEIAVCFNAYVYSGQATGRRIIEKGENDEFSIVVNESGTDSDSISLIPRNRHITNDEVFYTPFPTDTWAHYAFIISNTAPQVRIYIDAVLVASKTQTGIVACNDNSSLHVARYGGGGYFGKFIMSDLRIYTTIPSVAELEAMRDGTG